MCISRSFHMIDNYSADEFYDVRENFHNIDMIHILNNLTNGKNKCFDLISLNNRILLCLIMYLNIL